MVIKTISIRIIAFSRIYMNVATLLQTTSTVYH